MPLPILPSTTDLRTITERVNPLIKDYNRTPTASLTLADMFPPIFALDTGSATAYAIAPIPGIEQYVVGQPFIIKAANANSGTAPTLAVNGLTAGTITYPNGGALVAGDIPANALVEVVVASTTPTFHLLTRSVLPTIPIANTGATTFLAGDVALNNTANYFSGPNTGSIGANGWTIEISGVGSVVDTAGAANIDVAIFNGTTQIASNRVTTGGANFVSPVALPPIVVALSAATTFTLQARDLSSTSGKLQTTASAGAANVSTYITWVRIA